MCGSCASSWICACDGGETFGVCPCAKGVSCPICNHYASGTKVDGTITLEDLMEPSLLAKERAAYEAKQAAQK